MTARSPSDRSLIGSIGAHIRWAKDDPRTGTAAARKAFLDRFEREVDPSGVLDPAERSVRAEHARKAYFLGLALKSAAARRKPEATTRAPRRRTGTGELP